MGAARLRTSRSLRVEAQDLPALKEGDYRVAVDVRPYDHAYSVLRRLGCPTLDSSSEGKLLSAGVELGVPEIVNRTRGFEAQLGS